MEELTGLDADAVIGQSALEFFPHLREQHVDDLLARASSGESVSSPDVFYYVPSSGRRGSYCGNGGRRTSSRSRR